MNLNQVNEFPFILFINTTPSKNYYIMISDDLKVIFFFFLFINIFKKKK